MAGFYVGNHTYVRIGDLGKPADFTRMIHGKFEDSPFMAVTQAKQGQGQANQVVEVAWRFQHLKDLAQHRSRHLLGRGLAVGAGYCYH